MSRSTSTRDPYRWMRRRGIAGHRRASSAGQATAAEGEAREAAPVGGSRRHANPEWHLNTGRKHGHAGGPLLAICNISSAEGRVLGL